MNCLYMTERDETPGEIIGTNVVRFQERENCTNGKDICVLVKNRHLDNWIVDGNSKRF